MTFETPPHDGGSIRHHGHKAGKSPSSGHTPSKNPPPPTSAGRIAKAEAELQFDICPVRLVPDALPCLLVVIEQPAGFGRKEIKRQAVG